MYSDVRKRLTYINDAAVAQGITETERESVKVKVTYQSLTLDSESKSQRRLGEAVLARLTAESTLWFRVSSISFLREKIMSEFPNSASSPNHRRHVSEQFMAKLVLPRACMSPADAIFASRFVRLMHEIGTPNFASLMFYDRVSKHIF